MSPEQVKFVNDWRRAWRWYSMRALAVAGAIPTAWASMPMEWRRYFPAWGMALLAVCVVVSGIVGRVIDQEKKQPAPLDNSNG